MSKRKWTFFAQDMLESIDHIVQYICGVSFQDFLQDHRTQDAVVRNLEVLGEAARRIPPDIQERYPEIPWAQIVSLRNRLIHGYFLWTMKLSGRSSKTSCHHCDSDWSKSFRNYQDEHPVPYS